MVWSADEKASLFSAHFDAKQCRYSFLQLHSCDPSPIQCFVAIRSSFVRNLLLNLDPYGKNNSGGIFTLFYKQAARELAPNWL